MGSFSEICAISKNYIACGDKVKLLFVAQNGKADTNLLLPVFFPISGTYNDYGFIDNIVEDFNYKFFTGCLQKYFSHILPKTYRSPEGGLKCFVDLSYGHGCIGGAHLPAAFARSQKDPKFELRKHFGGGTSTDEYELTEGNETFVTFLMVKETVYDEILKSGMTLGFCDTYNYQEKIQLNTVVDNTPDFYISFARSIREFYLYKQLSRTIENAERGQETAAEMLNRMSMEAINRMHGRNGLKELFVHKPADESTVFKHENPLAASLQSILFDDTLFIASQEPQYNIDCFIDINRNMFVRELTHGLENDIEYAANILKSYVELFVYKIELQQLNMTYTGNRTEHSGEQCPGIKQALNSLFYVNGMATDLVNTMQSATDENGIELESFDLIESYSTDAHNAKVGKERLVGLRDSFLKHAEYLTSILNSENEEGEQND